ncbi:MAG: pyridoxal phosphate-dependent aminotransferase [SAR324 cluster bacterium]|nr:pyridoxal phosphate-dependent aminotransferase [SAR324 cluster bacterium]
MSGVSQKILDSMEASSWIRKMFEEGAKRAAEIGAENVFDFSIGNPVFEPPKEVNEALAQLATIDTGGLHRYMPNQGLPETRDYIAGKLNSETGLGLTNNEIIMSVGAGGGLNTVLKALLNPSEEVIVLVPYFVEYDHYISNHGGVHKRVETNEDFSLNFENIAAAINKRTKAIIINSPNNPTGVVYSATELQQLGQLLLKKSAEIGHTITLLSDEPYRRISYVGELPNILNHYKNSIIITSFSKDLALPGERIGYMAVHPEHAEKDLLIQAAVIALRILGFVNAPAIWQRVLPMIGDAMVDLTPYQANKDILVNGLREMGYQVTEPGGAFYLFVKSPIADDAEFIALAQKENLLLVPGRAFGRPGYFRISFCFATEKIEKSLPIFQKLIVSL